MTPFLILAAITLGAILGFFLAAVLVSGKADDAYRAGCIRGRRDLKAEMVAEALWHAEHDRFGGADS